jgi:hypothetical protein
MSLVLGRLILLLMIIFSFYLSFNDYRYPNAVNINMLLWTLVLLVLGLWTLKNPRLAFVLILIFYLITVVYRYITLNGEILLFLLVHIMFIMSMILSIWGTFSRKK